MWLILRLSFSLFAWFSITHHLDHIMYVDKESEVDPGVRHRRKDDLNVTRKSHSSCNASIASEKYVCLDGS